MTDLLTRGKRGGLNDAIEPIKGVATECSLPDENYDQLWNAIHLDGDQKDHLLNQAALTFTVRPKVDVAKLPFHGLIMLVGPPGTGKTSLARGSASRTAAMFPAESGFRFLEVEPHTLASSGLGRSQHEVRRLLAEVVAERAQHGPLIVLLDEVETLGTDRTQLSLAANPVDVHRATDAMLAGLDQLAAANLNLLFIATSNFAQAIDAALLSRADLIETIPLPSATAARDILIDAVHALATAYPHAANALHGHEFDQAAAACYGLDGRQIRKLVLSACTFDPETALDPNRLTACDLRRAAERAHRQTRTVVNGDLA